MALPHHIPRFLSYPGSGPVGIVSGLFLPLVYDLRHFESLFRPPVSGRGGIVQRPQRVYDIRIKDSPVQQLEIRTVSIVQSFQIADEAPQIIASQRALPGVHASARTGQGTL